MTGKNPNDVINAGLEVISQRVVMATARPAGQKTRKCEPCKYRRRGNVQKLSDD